MKRAALAMYLAVCVPAAALAGELKVTIGQEADDWIGQQHVLNGFGCSCGNVSPALEWTGGPAETKSYAVTLYDPDAPTGSGWWHWTLFNIPSSTNHLPEGSSSGDGLPQGAVQGRTDFGSAGYGGPCPPEGTEHRYVLTVWALGVEKVDLDDSASGAMVGFMLNATALDKVSVTTMYSR